MKKALISSSAVFRILILLTSGFRRLRSLPFLEFRRFWYPKRIRPKYLVFLLICRFYCLCSDVFKCQASKSSFCEMQLNILSQLWLLCFKKRDVKHNLLLLQHVNMYETISESQIVINVREWCFLIFQICEEAIQHMATVKNIANIICYSHSRHCHALGMILMPSQCL